MCGVAEAALVLAVVGTGLQVAGQQQQAKAAKAQANFRAQVARNNQIIAERKAEDARQRGRIRAGESDLKTRQRIASQRTRLAGAGQELGQGSALGITSDTAALGKLDSLRIVNNAEREAIGFETQGINFSSEAALASASGRNAQKAANIQSLGTIVTGASAVAGKWHDFKTEGAGSDN